MRAQIVGDGITEHFESLVGGSQLSRAVDDALFQFCGENTDLFLGSFALRDVADIALDHVVVTDLIHVADKLHGDLVTVARFQRQVFVADIPVGGEFKVTQRWAVRTVRCSRISSYTGSSGLVVAVNHQQLGWA